MLSSLHLMHYIENGGVEVICRLDKEKDENRDIENGIPLADNLKLRLTSQNDVDDLAFFPNTTKSVIPYRLNRYVIECSFDIVDDSEIMSVTSGKIIELINNAITGLRLLKSGYIDSNCILSVTAKVANRDRGLQAERSIPIPTLMEDYRLRTDELNQLRELIERISKIDFEKEKRLKVALRRFENSYYDQEDEDKLIDYMIAFEALFTAGTKGSKRDKISDICAKLLGEKKEDCRKIKDTLEFAYKTRNLIVHGEDFDPSNNPDFIDEDDFFLEDLVVEVEELLRKSIKAIIREKG